MSEHKCYTVKYECFTEKNGKIFSAADDEYTLCSDNTNDLEESELLFIAWVRPAPKGSRFSITIPEEHDGRPVSAAAILFEKQITPLKAGYDIPMIDHLYISSNVRHLRIETSITRPSKTLGIVEEIINIINECTVEISPENPYLCVYKNGIYSKDMTELFYIFSPDEVFEVPMGVKTIGSDAGSSLKGLKKLVTPESVTEIKRNSFDFCPDLEYADIHAKSIESHAFSACDSLTSVKIAGCKIIHDGAFEYCRRLETAELFEPEMLGGMTFLGCTSIKRIDLYLKEDAPFRLYGRQDEEGSLLAVHSSDTGDILFELITFENIDKVFTENGFDLSFYDKMLKNKISKSKTKVRQFMTHKGLPRHLFQVYDVLFNGVMARLRYPYKMNDGTRELLESFAAEQAEQRLKDMIDDPFYTAHTIASHQYLELADNNCILRLIDASALAGRTELTAELMQKLHESDARD